MDDSDVAFLDPGSFAGGNHQGEVDQPGNGPAVPPQKPHRMAASRPCQFQGGADIPGGPAGGTPDDHIAGYGQRLNLPGKDGIKSVVVPNGGQNGTVGGERNSGKTAPLHLEPADDLGRQVLRIRRRPAITHDKQFVPGAERPNQQVDSLGDAEGEIPLDERDDLAMGAQLTDDPTLHNPLPH